MNLTSRPTNLGRTEGLRRRTVPLLVLLAGLPLVSCRGDESLQEAAERTEREVREAEQAVARETQRANAATSVPATTSVAPTTTVRPTSTVAPAATTSLATTSSGVPATTATPTVRRTPAATSSPTTTVAVPLTGTTTPAATTTTTTPAGTTTTTTPAGTTTTTTPADTTTTTTVHDSIVRVTIWATNDAEIRGVTGGTVVSQPTDPLTEPWVVDIDRSETLTIDAGYDNWAPTDGATCTFGGSNLSCEFSAVTGNTVTVTLSWQSKYW